MYHQNGDCGMGIEDCGLGIADWGLRIGGLQIGKLQIADWEIKDYRFTNYYAAADCGLGIRFRWGICLVFGKVSCDKCLGEVKKLT